MDSPRTELTASRAPKTSVESMKAGRQARDKVRNGGRRRECRFLSPSLRRRPIQDMEATPKNWNKAGCVRGNRLEPFQLFGASDGPRIGREHRKCISKGFARTSAVPTKGNKIWKLGRQSTRLKQFAGSLVTKSWNGTSWNGTRRKASALAASPAR